MTLKKYMDLSIDKARILVVEDEVIIARDIQNSLTDFGYEVPLIVASGEEAIVKAAELSPDLVLMDIHLKGAMDGIDAAKEITRLLGVPIIYLTAYADKETLARAKQTSPFSYLLKPFDEQELQISIEFALFKYKLEKQQKEDQQWLLTILKSMGDGVIACNTKNQVIFMNPIAEQLTGWQQDVAVGQDPATVFHVIHGETRQVIESPIKRVLQAGTTFNLPLETVLISKDGTETFIDDSASPIKDEIGKIHGAVLVFHEITERKVFEEQLRHIAVHDALTGLPNRVLFTDRLKQAIERTKRFPEHLFAVLFLDCDRFKIVNDTLGHAAGDRLLMEVSKRLKRSTRSFDTVARFGGDEFAILLEEISDLSMACRIAERFLEMLAAPYIIQEQEVVITASIGLVISLSPFDSEAEILRNADIALYRAKDSGRGCFQVFNNTMHAQMQELMQIERDLRGAIERDEIQAYYQPILSLGESPQLVGFEALARWQHPQRGLLSPFQFIDIAEQLSLVHLIDLSIMRQACYQLKTWQDTMPNCLDLMININFSSMQFKHPNLFHKISEILNETQLNPHSLKIEITESVIIENAESSANVLLQLQSLGIKIAIDDFGIGYSSLSYLYKFPISSLKLDKSFIIGLEHDTQKQEIVQAIVTLAHSLGKDVTAEGIETREQLHQVQSFCSDYGQGYLFARPLSPEAIVDWLNNPHSCFIHSDSI